MIHLDYHTIAYMVKSMVATIIIIYVFMQLISCHDLNSIMSYSISGFNNTLAIYDFLFVCGKINVNDEMC